MPRRPQRTRRALFFRLHERIEDSYYAIPLVFVLTAAGLAFALVELDHGLQRANVLFAFTGGPQSARAILSAIASSMITFTGLVFSITVLALQLTSSQFTPRSLRNFLRDRINQCSLGVFLATFVFALLALRAVRGGTGDVGATFIPGVTITFAVMLVGFSVVMFIVYIHHAAQSMRISHLLVRIAAETRGALATLVVDAGDLDDTNPVRASEAGATPRAVAAPCAGVLTGIDHAGIVREAAGVDAVVHVGIRTGDFVPCGAPLLFVSGGRADRDDRLARFLVLSRERSLDEDAAFGLRQLVDIAERALSPGTNDPTTAVQCIDQLHDLLRGVAGRPFVDGLFVDDHDRVRLVTATWTWPALLHLACDEIRHSGAGSPRVHRRLHGLLVDLLSVTDGERRVAVLDQLRFLDRRRAEVPASERALLDGRATAKAVGT